EPNHSAPVFISKSSVTLMGMDHKKHGNPSLQVRGHGIAHRKASLTSRSLALNTDIALAAALFPIVRSMLRMPLIPELSWLFAWAGIFLALRLAGRIAFRASPGEWIWALRSQAEFPGRIGFTEIFQKPAGFAKGLASGSASGSGRRAFASIAML